MWSSGHRALCCSRLNIVNTDVVHGAQRRAVKGIVDQSEGYQLLCMNDGQSFEYHSTCVHVYCMVLWRWYENKMIVLFLNQTFHLQLSNRKGT